jgi:hypothetical protein
MSRRDTRSSAAVPAAVVEASLPLNVGTAALGCPSFDCHPEQAFFAQRRIWASRAVCRVLCDTIIARLARFLTKLHYYLTSH